MKLFFNHRGNAKLFFSFQAFPDELNIPVFKNVQVQIFAGVHNYFKRKYGNEIRHTVKIRRDKGTG